MPTLNGPIEIAPFTITELTQLDVDTGTGVLDILLRNLRINLELEYNQNRINGVEYAQVYSELYQANLNASVSYVAMRTKLGYELRLLELQTEQLAASLLKVPAEIAQIEAETAQTNLITTSRIPADVLQVKAQTSLTDTQRLNVIEEMTLIPQRVTLLQGQVTQVGAETQLTLKNVDRLQQELAKIPLETEILRKESLRMDAQVNLVNKQVDEITLQLGKVPKEIELLAAQTAQQSAATAQTTATTDRITKETLQKLPIEVTNLTKQGQQLEAEVSLTTSRKAEIDASIEKIPVEIELTQAQIANMSRQSLILDKELELKRAEIDIRIQQLDIDRAELDLKREQLEIARAQVATTEAQTALYAQKVVTEKAQTDSTVIGVGSVIGLNNMVLQGQVNGYKRDAEQKTAKVLLDAWMVGAQNQEREANSINKLTDTQFGGVMTKLFQGIDVVL